jgi:hypothetical protein
MPDDGFEVIRSNGSLTISCLYAHVAYQAKITVGERLASGPLTREMFAHIYERLLIGKMVLWALTGGNCVLEVILSDDGVNDFIIVKMPLLIA